MDSHERHLAEWVNAHDNGWTARILEAPNGTFGVWVSNGQEAARRPDYVEDGPDNARRAAEYALRERAGHDRCSDRCSGWTLRAHGA